MSEGNEVPGIPQVEVLPPKKEAVPKLAEVVSRDKIEARLDVAERAVANVFDYDQFVFALDEAADRQIELAAGLEPKLAEAVSRVAGEKGAAKVERNIAAAQEREAKRKGREFSKARAQVVKAEAVAGDMDAKQSQYRDQIGEAKSSLDRELEVQGVFAEAAAKRRSRADEKARAVSYPRAVLEEVSKLPGFNEANARLEKIRAAAVAVEEAKRRVVEVTATKLAVSGEIIEGVRSGSLTAEVIADEYADKKGGKLVKLDRETKRINEKNKKKAAGDLNRSGFADVAKAYVDTAGAIEQEESNQKEDARREFDLCVEGRLDSMVTNSKVGELARQIAGERLDKLIANVPDRCLDVQRAVGWEAEHSGSLKDPIRRKVFEEMRGVRTDVASELGCVVEEGDDGARRVTVGEGVSFERDGVVGKMVKAELTIQVGMETLKDEELRVRVEAGDLEAVAEVVAISEAIGEAVELRNSLENMAKARINSVVWKDRASTAAEWGVKGAEAVVAAGVTYLVARGIAGGAETLGVNVDVMVAQAGEKISTAWDGIRQAGQMIVEQAASQDLGGTGQGVDSASKYLWDVRVWETVRNVGPKVADVLHGSKSIMEYAAPVAAVVAAGASLTERGRAAFAKVTERFRKK